jgi:hypothetical protein
LSDLPPLGNPDLVQVALKAPRGVVCLISGRFRHRYAIDHGIILRVITINLMIFLCLWCRHLFSTEHS